MPLDLHSRGTKILLGATVAAAAAGVAVGVSAVVGESPPRPVEVASPEGQQLSLPGGIGSQLDPAKLRLVASGAGFNVWRGAALDPANNDCKVVMISGAPGGGASVTCGASEQEDKARIQREGFASTTVMVPGGRVQSLIEVAEDAKVVTVDGKTYPILGGRVVFVPVLSAGSAGQLTIERPGSVVRASLDIPADAPARP